MLRCVLIYGVAFENSDRFLGLLAILLVALSFACRLASTNF